MKITVKITQVKSVWSSSVDLAFGSYQCICHIGKHFSTPQLVTTVTCQSPGSVSTCVGAACP